jgi:Family of unknown function (DUF5670)
MCLVTDGSSFAILLDGLSTRSQFQNSSAPVEHGEVDMLWTVFVVLLILWLLGFSLHIGGGLIHLLLVVGLVVLVINLLSGRQSAV